MTTATAPAPPRRTASASGSYVLTLGGSVAVLAVNLVTGIVASRLLGADGRGVVGAISGWILMLAFLGGLGVRDGLVYVQSRERAHPGTVLAWGLVSILGLGLATVLVAELLVPVGYQAQGADTRRLAAVFMVAILPMVGWNTLGSLLAAHHRFAAQTAQRVAQPVLYALALGGLWAFDEVRPSTVLAALTASYVATAVYALVVLLRDTGLGPLERPAGAEAARYGIRVYGNTLGSLVNARLDLMVLPAVLASEQIGLYVVAVSIASMMSGVFGSIDGTVFALAARLDGDEATELVVRSARLVFTASLVCAVVLAVVAPPLVGLVYGDEFRGSVTSLRLLLPGIVLWSAATVVGCGHKAAGRPGTASIAQGVGAIVTVVGLATTLGPWGINGAAITSSLSYGVVFVTGVVLLARRTGVRAWSVVDVRRAVADLRWLRAGSPARGTARTPG
jgi:O-antigen/teichoic acid export membrane protein